MLDYTAVGGAVNLASRLEHLALPGTAVVSEETFMLVNQFFKFKLPEETEVKGFLRKVKYYALDEKGCLNSVIVWIVRVVEPKPPST